jgi:hypothetical protein
MYIFTQSSETLIHLPHHVTPFWKPAAQNWVGYTHSQPEQYLMFSFCSAGEMLLPKCISVDLRGENCWGRGTGSSEDYAEVPLEWVPELFPGLHSLCVATRGPGVSLYCSCERSCANFATQFLTVLRNKQLCPYTGSMSFRQLNRDY